MTQVKGLARLKPTPTPHTYCDVYTCTSPGAYVVQHREGLFGTTHLILCQDCAEAMLADLPEELRRKVFETHPEVTTADILHRLIESPEIRAFVRGEPVAEDIQEALGRFIDLLAAEVPREEGIYCPKCHKGPFKSEMALRGHLANCPAKSKEPANDD